MTSLAGVSATAVLTLRARAEEHALPRPLLRDPVAAEWFARVEWPRHLDRWYSPFARTKTAVRAWQLDLLCRELLEAEPRATLVELGCGLSTRAARLGLPPARHLALDLPEVIALRAALGADPARMIAGSVLDPAWLDRVTGPAVLVAEGLLYYLPRGDVDALLRTLRERLPGAPLLLDVVGAVDLSRAARASRLAGAPILWASPPPLERAHEALGLAPILGLEPARVLADTIAGFEHRFGPLFGSLLRLLARTPYLGVRRSGIVAGTLGSPR